ncbi:hypothetical protein BKA65DRAFT_547417 [Rhexocercosporidium sp. MPI-PUGE-AT-0058]|nr:hypothetical protein BKA65DRAFT_547417 [Rhexocercosporidium sp. MPI-PUGE-AT-0058]
MSFARVSNDADSLRRSLSVSNNSSGGSATADSSRWDEDFMFDNIILNTTVYRKAFVKQQSKAQLRNKDDEDITSPKGRKSHLSSHSEETMRSPAPKLVPKNSTFNLIAPQLAPLPDFGLAFFYQLSPRAPVLTNPTVEEPTNSITARATDTKLESIAPPPKMTEKYGHGNQKPVETQLDAQHSDPFTNSLAGTTPNLPKPSIDEEKPQINEHPSPEQLPSARKEDDSAATMAQDQISEKFPYFKDWYSQDEIHPGDLVSVVWAYRPRASDEFDLERGDVLKVMALWDDGWGIGVFI